MSNSTAHASVLGHAQPGAGDSAQLTADNPPQAVRYATIVADPPWQVMAGPLNGREGFGDATGASRPLAYPSMTVDEIAALPVRDVAANDAHLYLWTTNGYLQDAFRVMKAWGFEYSTTLVWAKNVMGGGLGGAYGISTEFCLFGRRGSLKATGRVSGTWFNWPRPYDGRGKPMHSGKPEAFTDMVEQVSPGPYLEMFARRNRLGWHAWGNECLQHVDIAKPDYWRPDPCGACQPGNKPGPCF